MATYRVTHFIREFNFTWSESWVFSNAGDDIRGAVFQVRNLATKRAACLGRDAAVIGQRVAQIVNNANQPVTRKTMFNKFFLPGNANKVTVPIRTSLQLTFISADQVHQKLLYMGGVWRALNPFDDVFDAGNLGAEGWATAFQSWVAELITAKCGWMSRSVNLQQQITDYTVDPLSLVTTYTLKAPGMGFPVLGKPYTVNVDFPGGHSALDGIQQVFASAQQTVPTVRPRPATPFTIPGTMTLYSYAPVLLSTTDAQGNAGTANIQQFVGHQRGNSELGSRGRRRAFLRA